MEVYFLLSPILWSLQLCYIYINWTRRNAIVRIIPPSKRKMNQRWKMDQQQKNAKCLQRSILQRNLFMTLEKWIAFRLLLPAYYFCHSTLFIGWHFWFLFVNYNPNSLLNKFHVLNIQQKRFIYTIKGTRINKYDKPKYIAYLFMLSISF